MKDYLVEVNSWGDTDIYLCRQCKDVNEAKSRVKEYYAKMHIEIGDSRSHSGICIYSTSELNNDPLVTVASYSYGEPL